jgi:hypothetical protein
MRAIYINRTSDTINFGQTLDIVSKNLHNYVEVVPHGEHLRELVHSNDCWIIDGDKLPVTHKGAYNKAFIV